MFATAQTKWTFDAHWQTRNKIKKGDFQCVLQRLNKWGRLVGGIVGFDPAATLSDNLFTFAEMLAVRDDLFAEWKRNFPSLALRSLTEKELDILKKAPTATLATIMSQTLLQLTDKLSAKEQWGELGAAWASVVLIQCRDDRCSRLCLGLIGSSLSIKNLQAAQRSAVLALGEKILLLTDVKVMLDAREDLEKGFEKAGVPSLEHMPMLKNLNTIENSLQLCVFCTDIGRCDLYPDCA